MENELAEELEALQSIYSPEEVDVARPEGSKPASVTLKVDKRPVVTFLLSGELTIVCCDLNNICQVCRSHIAWFCRRLMHVVLD